MYEVFGLGFYYHTQCNTETIRSPKPSLSQNHHRDCHLVVMTPLVEKKKKIYDWDMDNVMQAREKEGLLMAKEHGG